MWFSEKALVFVDTRSAALAVYRQGFSGPRLERFAFERFGSRAAPAAPFSDVLAGSSDAVARLARDLRAPFRDATLLLPLGASFPSIVDALASRQGAATEVEETDLVRFRLAPLLPFPIASSEVRTERSLSIRRGAVLAQAILKATITEGERVMSSIGFGRPHVTSALSAALRGLPPRLGTVDLVFGDSACAIAVRDPLGAIEAIHLRLLVDGDDRAQRSIDEALRATAEAREIRVLGEDAASLRGKARDSVVSPAFDEPARGTADPQQFPFLSVFHERSAK
ncbi:MAG: hypothetical protein ABI565_12705 [Vicinamibacteria bacterium]